MSRLAWLDDDDPRHGSFSSYTNHGCRCEPCSATNREHQRKLRERRKQEREKTST